MINRCLYAFHVINFSSLRNVAFKNRNHAAWFMPAILKQFHLKTASFLEWQEYERWILLRNNNIFTMQATNSTTTILQHRQSNTRGNNQQQRSPSQFEVLFLYNKYSCKFMYSFAYVHEVVCNSCSNFM